MVARSASMARWWSWRMLSIGLLRFVVQQPLQF